LESAVGADRREHAAAVLGRRVDDLRAVRREARGLVETAVRQQVESLRRDVPHRDAIAVVLAVHERDELAVRRHAWASAVSAIEGDALRALPGFDADAVDLRAARAVGIEVDAAAVRSPGRLRVDAGVRRE